MKEFSPLDSILKWIESYRSGKYTLGQFQTRLSWLVEAVRLQKEQFEQMMLPQSIPEHARAAKESFVQILGLMVDALEKTDQHLREGRSELLKTSLVTIHDVHNKLHDLKDTMISSFPKEELLS
jgi:soluble cytochrome b562